MNTAALNNLWGYLSGLSLTTDNREWLADKLINGDRAKAKSVPMDKFHIGDVTLPTDKFLGTYDFSQEDEDRMRMDYLKEKYQLD